MSSLLTAVHTCLQSENETLEMTINLISIMAQTHVQLQSAKIKYLQILCNYVNKSKIVSIIISLSHVSDRHKNKLSLGINIISLDEIFNTKANICVAILEYFFCYQ